MVFSHGEGLGVYCERNRRLGSLMASQRWRNEYWMEVQFSKFLASGATTTKVMITGSV